LAALPPDGCGVPPAGKEMSIPSLSCKSAPDLTVRGVKATRYHPGFASRCRMALNGPEGLGQ